MYLLRTREVQEWTDNFSPTYRMQIENSTISKYNTVLIKTVKFRIRYIYLVN